MAHRNSRMAQVAILCIKNIGKNDFKEYKSRANSFPVMVMQSGLAQATGFLLAKNGVYRRYLDDLASVLNSAETWQFATGEALHEKIINCDTLTYRLLTRDVLQASGWMKRYCQAFSSQEEPKNDTVKP